jgi:putative heme-binding domain-containing protein
MRTTGANMNFRRRETASVGWDTKRAISLPNLFRLAAAATVCAATFLGPQQNPRSSRSTDAALVEGRQTFAAICANCHGLDGRGGERAPDIAVRPDARQLSDAMLVQIIRQGKPGTGMPAFRSLGNSRIQAVVQHLRKLQGQGATAAEPGSPEAGKALFFGKAACSDCHMANGAGGFMASDLSNFGGTHSAQQIRESITDPNKNLDHLSETVVATTLDGRTLTGIARNEDNFSLQLQTADGVFHLIEKSNLQRLEHRPESLMPSDYESRLKPQELDDIVGYLMSLGRRGQAGLRKEEKGVKHMEGHTPH